MIVKFMKKIFILMVFLLSIVGCAVQEKLPENIAVDGALERDVSANVTFKILEIFIDED